MLEAVNCIKWVAHIVVVLQGWSCCLPLQPLLRTAVHKVLFGSGDREAKHNNNPLCLWEDYVVLHCKTRFSVVVKAWFHFYWLKECLGLMQAFLIFVILLWGGLDLCCRWSAWENTCVSLSAISIQRKIQMKMECLCRMITLKRS